MLQNEGLDEKKKQYATCALDSTSPKEGEGGRLADGICVGCKPICHFFKSIFWAKANKFLRLFLIPGKPCWFCCVQLECFAVCWEFKLCLAIIYKLKGGKRGENFGNIASISQTHLFHKFYIIFHFLHTLLAALPSQWLFIGL